MRKFQQEDIDTLTFWRDHYRTRDPQKSADYQRQLDQLFRPKKKKIRREKVLPTSEAMTYILKFSQKVLDELKLEIPELNEYRITSGKARRSKLVTRKKEIRFGAQSVESRWDTNHHEYASVHHIIQGLHNNRETAAQLEALHEIAHAVVRVREPHFDRHGPIFCRVYAELINRFYSPPEFVTVGNDFISIRGEAHVELSFS